MADKEFNDLLKAFDVVENKKNICKGLIFKGYSSQYYNQKTHTLERKEGLRLLKNKSCKGECNGKYCDWPLEDCIKELVHDKYAIIWPDHIENGKLYKVIMCNITTDWESGYVDDFDLKIVEI